MATGSVVKNDTFTSGGLEPLASHVADYDYYAEGYPSADSGLYVSAGNLYQYSVGSVYRTAIISNDIGSESNQDYVLTLQAGPGNSFYFNSNAALKLTARGGGYTVELKWTSATVMDLGLYVGGVLVDSNLGIPVDYNTVYPLIFSVIGTGISASFAGNIVSATDGTYTSGGCTIGFRERRAINVDSLVLQFDSYILPTRVTIADTPSVNAVAHDPVWPTVINADVVTATLSSDPVEVRTARYAYPDPAEVAGLAFAPNVQGRYQITDTPVVSMAALNVDVLTARYAYPDAAEVTVTAAFAVVASQVAVPDTPVVATSVYQAWANFTFVPVPDVAVVTLDTPEPKMRLVFPPQSGNYKRFDHVLATMGLATNDPFLMSIQGRNKTRWQAWLDTFNVFVKVATAYVTTTVPQVVVQIYSQFKPGNSRIFIAARRVIQAVSNGRRTSTSANRRKFKP